MLWLIDFGRRSIDAWVDEEILETKEIRDEEAIDKIFRFSEV